jgi:predicted S18 family serine protease
MKIGPDKIAYIIIGLAVAFLVGMPSAQLVVGKASIYAPAVLVTNNTGSITTINLTVYKGDGSVTVVGPTIVGASTTASAETAAAYAANYLSLNFKSYNFTYAIINGGDNVSGPSGGAAMTLLAISALSGKRMLRNFTMTGTISSNGTIGEIGGAFDKSAAAKLYGLSFILVPAAPNDDQENELYLLAQDELGIPLIRVSNISQAYGFAFGQTKNITNYEANYTIFTNINVTSLQQAQLSCSNNCSASQFSQLVSFTFNLTNFTIGMLSHTPQLRSITSQEGAMLEQEKALASKGYLYAAADQAFLTYIDTSYFNSYSYSIAQGFSAVQNVTQYCREGGAPQLTTKNYEYVLGGELRQQWGLYTANTTLSVYNGTVETTDDVLLMMRRIATANAWCDSANEMYYIANSTSGDPVVPSTTLAALASNRIALASKYSTDGMYITLAKSALSNRDYPMAILQADYEYALDNASAVAASSNTAALLNMSDRLAMNSTYGTWATQFANEAEFYIQEAQMSPNSTQAHAFASSAYSSALLASQLSADFSAINSNLLPATSAAENSAVTALNNRINQLSKMLIVMFAIIVVLLCIAVYMQFKLNEYERKSPRRRRAPKSRKHK